LALNEPSIEHLMTITVIDVTVELLAVHDIRLVCRRHKNPSYFEPDARVRKSCDRPLYLSASRAIKVGTAIQRCL
jgi:hypothetical protein